MEPTRKFFQDKLILLLVSSNVFLAFLCIVLIFLRIGQGSGEGYIIEYRSNLGISAFARGSIGGIIGLGVFAIITACLSIVISIRTYTITRVLSILMLGSGLLLLILTLIVSNALLVLR
ncbi:MAG: hypothetical protein ACREGD_01590 [Candidatus Saccharimonadales bacterium]